MKEISVDMAKQILKKYDEILLLCGAKEEELLSVAFDSFSHEVQQEVEKSDIMKDKNKEEKDVATLQLQDAIVSDMMILIGTSLAKCLEAVGKTLVSTAQDKNAMKKAADEWLNKAFRK